jgi:ribonuclease BN (tRNA processing enzyme)
MPSVTFLGTGPGDVAAGRFQASILLEVGDHYVLLDAGEPCSSQLLDLGFPLPDLDAVWITHAHADHLGGLPLLIQASWLRGRKSSLPLGVPEHLSAPLRAWLDTILLSPDVTRFPLDIFAWQTGKAVAMDDIAVTPHPTTHLKGFKKMTGKAEIASFLFDIVSGGRRFVYSGDLGSPSDLRDVLREPADLLICELAHFTPEELLTALRDAKVGTLCLTHVSTELDELRGEIQMLFEGELSGIDAIYLPEDGERIDL